jgi:hypothetical protein
MSHVTPCPLPDAALLRRYADGPGYADCFVTEMAGTVSQASFVEAFYTTPLFKTERMLLALFAARASTDAQAALLAAGSVASFAAWRVEARNNEQLLLADFTGRTRSWLMTVQRPEQASTFLYFGSAVVPGAGVAGKHRLGFPFDTLLRFHQLYSRLLLQSARARINKMGTEVINST